MKSWEVASVAVREAVRIKEAQLGVNDSDIVSAGELVEKAQTIHVDGTFFWRMRHVAEQLSGRELTPFYRRFPKGYLRHAINSCVENGQIRPLDIEQRASDPLRLQYALNRPREGSDRLVGISYNLDSREKQISGNRLRGFSRLAFEWGRLLVPAKA
ncbi:MAG TPA: hypothetical protein VLG27_05040 [Candidatus Saccharimonadia bacterium]|nr:hypothetical protein [Candidatus Saccharimonadia bacterium]